MTEPAKRLGDVIDDYCPRCRLLLNHAIASLVDGSAAKVICQTCFTEHPYRRGELPKKKPRDNRAKLFREVSAGVPTPSLPQQPADAAAAPRKRTSNPARYISRRHSATPGGKPPRR